MEEAKNEYHMAADAAEALAEVRTTAAGIHAGANTTDNKENNSMLRRDNINAGDNEVALRYSPWGRVRLPGESEADYAARIQTVELASKLAH